MNSSIILAGGEIYKHVAGTEQTVPLYDPTFLSLGLPDPALVAPTTDEGVLRPPAGNPTLNPQTSSPSLGLSMDVPSALLYQQALVAHQDAANLKLVVDELRAQVQLASRHPHSKSKVTVKRSQLPVMPAFAITAHKAQGKTMRACVVNFTGCKGTESPYVMVLRATSLDALVILTPFPKARICSRQSEDVRVDFRRLEHLALQTVIANGTPEEAARATLEIRNAPSTGAPSSVLGTVSAVATGDVYGRLDRLQRANAVLTAPVRRSRISIGTGVTVIPLSFSSTTTMAGPSSLVFLPPNSQPLRTRTQKRKLDDTFLPGLPDSTRKHGLW